MLGHAMWLASGRAKKKDIDEWFIQMGWLPRKKRRRVKKVRRKRR